MGWSWVNLILGIWTFFSPFILSFSSVRSALWNDVILGIIIVIISVIALGTAEPGVSWWNAAAGVWLIISPFVLFFFQLSATAVWNNVVVGILIVIFSLVRVFAAGPTGKAST